jgi:8-amino-7-oxononanoate synthase
VLGSEMLRNYLINFSRAFIYTTALPEISIEAIRKSYEIFPGMYKERNHLQQLIHSFREEALKHVAKRNDIEVIKSLTPIQAVVVPGNDNVRALSQRLAKANLDIRPILYPTVPKGKERLRIVLHSFNNMEEVNRLMDVLGDYRSTTSS